MPLPAIVILLCAGIVAGILSPWHFGDEFAFATLYVLLPALLFEAALKLDSAEMRRQWLPIALLAGPGVVITAALVAACAAWLHLPLAAGLLLGTTLAATDPVAVIAIFRHIRIPAALATIIESEALLNDAVAVALYAAVLVTLAVHASASSVAHVAASTVVGAAASVSIGIAFGAAARVLIQIVRTRLASVALTSAAAYGAYFSALAVHSTGLFATIAAALILQSVVKNQPAGFTKRFWSFSALSANALLFFCTGLAVNPLRIIPYGWPLVAIFATLIFGRLILSNVLLHAGMGRAPWSWPRIVHAAGIRGALSLALALSLPLSLHGRDLVIAIVLGIVIVTTLTAALSLPYAAKRIAPQ